MSGRREKAKRRAEGLTSDALHGMRDFEAEVARVRAARAAELDGPITSLAPKRRALAWVGLALFAVAVLSVLAGSC